jgi:hypothetical protein
MHAWLTGTVRLARLTLVRDGGARANPECGAGSRPREPNGALSRIVTKNSKILLLKWYI